MNTKMKTLIKMTALGALMASTGSFGANGALSKVSSEATAVIKGSIPALIRVTGFGDALDELDLGAYDFAAPADLVVEDSFCVYRNSSAGLYQITFTGDGGTVPGTAFKISNGTSDMAYTVRFGDDGTLDTDMTTATAVGAQVASRSPTCATGNVAKVQVKVAQAVADAADQGDYTGDLTVLVAPL
jgi:hypothetical protein